MHTVALFVASPSHGAFYLCGFLSAALRRWCLSYRSVKRPAYLHLQSPIRVRVSIAHRHDSHRRPIHLPFSGCTDAGGHTDLSKAGPQTRTRTWGGTPSHEQFTGEDPPRSLESRCVLWGRWIDECGPVASGACSSRADMLDARWCCENSGLDRVGQPCTRHVGVE